MIQLRLKTLLNLNCKLITSIHSLQAFIYLFI